ncbi:MAG: hypothetical protein GKR91_05040 [Pseudomonadales bacterium]|nr:hypothetical protein [Pseudomonadales bacterium]
MNRKSVLDEITNQLISIQQDHPIRVGIDGVDASGKTSLASELASSIEEKDLDVISLSIDGFHNPKAVRYKQGEDSPLGYFQDSFNIREVLNEVLVPLGPNGNLSYKQSVFDLTTDSPVESPTIKANSRSILLFEGLFLHRPELIDHWDFSIFVHTDFEITIERAIKRDIDRFGTTEGVCSKYRKRYIPGQMIYLESVDPQSKATLIVNNNDIANPELLVN